MTTNRTPEPVTVEDAIRRGKRMVNLPITLIMLVTLVVCFYVGLNDLAPYWIIPSGFGIAFVLGWIYWSFTITRWRLWAFEHVRNVHELKKRAVQEKLIWPDDNLFEKTEIRSSASRQKWKSLQNKFKEEDLFTDDPGIPRETLIYYSKAKNFLEMGAMLFCSAIGIFLLAVSDSYIIGSVMMLAGAFYGYKNFREATNKQPQIILNSKGIETTSAGFTDSRRIRNEEVIQEGSGKHIRHCLVYDHPNGSEHLQIDDLDTDQNALNNLLRVYRGRSK